MRNMRFVCNIDEVYIYVHGGKSVLYFKDDINIGFSGEKYSFESLNFKRIKLIGLFSCRGGEGYEKENIAWFFARRTGAKVWACNGKVSFTHDKTFNVEIPRKSFHTPFATFKTFWYDSYIAKERVGVIY